MKFHHGWGLGHKKFVPVTVQTKIRTWACRWIRWPRFQRFINTIIIARYVCKAFIPLLLYRFCFKFTWKVVGRRECSHFFLFKMHYSQGTRWQNDYTKSLRRISFSHWWNGDFHLDEVPLTFASCWSPPKILHQLLLLIYEMHLFQEYNNIINVAKIMRLKRR